MRYLLVCLLLVSCKVVRYDVGQLITSKGEILIWLHNETPNHKKSFNELSASGYWNNTSFNRVIPEFVVQGGCPDTPQGFNDLKELLRPEFKKGLTHVYGAVGAGRDNNPEKLSARCQFYIVQNKKGLPRLDGEYTVFGQVIKGMDVVDVIVGVKRDSLDAPITPVLLSVNIIKIKEAELKRLYSDFK